MERNLLKFYSYSGSDLPFQNILLEVQEVIMWYSCSSDIFVTDSISNSYVVTIERDVLYIDYGTPTTVQNRLPTTANQMVPLSIVRA